MVAFKDGGSLFRVRTTAPSSVDNSFVLVYYLNDGSLNAMDHNGNNITIGSKDLNSSVHAISSTVDDINSNYVKKSGDNVSTLIITDSSDATSISSAPTIHNGGMAITKSIIMGPMTAPISSTNGQLWNDSSQNTLSTKLSNINQNLIGCIFSQINDSTLSNSITETSIISGGIGTTTLPANCLLPGKTLRLRFLGTANTAGVLQNGNLIFKIKIGSTILATSSSISLGVGINNALIDIQFLLTCKTTGTSGTVIGQGSVSTYSSGGTIYSGLVMSSPTTINTTLSQALDATATWSISNSSNTLIINNGTIEILN